MSWEPLILRTDSSIPRSLVNLKTIGVWFQATHSTHNMIRCKHRKYDGITKELLILRTHEPYLKRIVCIFISGYVWRAPHSTHWSIIHYHINCKTSSTLNNASLDMVLINLAPSNFKHKPIMDGPFHPSCQKNFISCQQLSISCQTLPSKTAKSDTFIYNKRRFFCKQSYRINQFSTPTIHCLTSSP